MHDPTRLEIYDDDLRLGEDGVRDNDGRSTAVGREGEQAGPRANQYRLSPHRCERRGVEHDELVLVTVGAEVDPERHDVAPARRKYGRVGVKAREDLPVAAVGEEGAALPIPHAQSSEIIDGQVPLGVLRERDEIAFPQTAESARGEIADAEVQVIGRVEHHVPAAGIDDHVHRDERQRRPFNHAR
jgi:hypothetical protein